MLDLRQVMTESMVVPSLRGSTKREVIEELLDVLDAQGALTDRAGALAAVWGREESMPTGLTDGVAIPHGRSDAVRRLVCAMGVHHAGVDFGLADGQASTIVLLTIAPQSRPEPHVQFMATVR